MRDRALHRGYSAADDEKLADLWAKGLSAGEIGQRMDPVRSRNAVLGRARRLGLPKRDNPGGGKATRKAPRTPEAKQAPPPYYVDREPCPRCQVRGDIGCEHRRPGEAAPQLAMK